NIVGSANVSDASLSAGFAGPGCRMLVAHWSAVPIGWSFGGGFEPKGSVAVCCCNQAVPTEGFRPGGVPESASAPGKDGKLYSLLAMIASRLCTTRSSRNCFATSGLCANFQMA